MDGRLNVLMPRSVPFLGYSGPPQTPCWLSGVWGHNLCPETLMLWIKPLILWIKPLSPCCWLRAFHWALLSSFPLVSWVLSCCQHLSLSLWASSLFRKSAQCGFRYWWIQAQIPALPLKNHDLDWVTLSLWAWTSSTTKKCCREKYQIAIIFSGGPLRIKWDTTSKGFYTTGGAQ